MPQQSPNAVSVYQRAADLLIEAVFPAGHSDGLVAMFGFARPGSSPYQGKIGMEIAFGRKELLRAALYLRANGPEYLRYLSIEEIWSLLQNFVTENFWYISDGSFGFTHTDPEQSYARKVSALQRMTFARSLRQSSLFHPAKKLNLFTLVPILVRAEFISDAFFLVKPSALESTLKTFGLWNASLLPDRYPPIAEWKGRIETPASWLGLQSPSVKAAHKTAAVILGAIALTPVDACRYSFSGRKMFGGACTISVKSASFGGFETPHTPPLMYDIGLDTADHEWLTLLSTKLGHTDKATRREMHALRYFYWAWSLEPTERFPVLCMMLDALYGDADRATQSIIDAVRKVLGIEVDEKRLRTLLRLRNSVVHGRAPTVYDAPEYEAYYLSYEEDPVSDLEIVAAFCLRSTVFAGAMRQHDDPNASIIKEMQARGRLPSKLRNSNILSP